MSIYADISDSCYPEFQPSDSISLNCTPGSRDNYGKIPFNVAPMAPSANIVWAVGHIISELPKIAEQCAISYDPVRCNGDVQGFWKDLAQLFLDSSISELVDIVSEPDSDVDYCFLTDATDTYATAPSLEDADEGTSEDPPALLSGATPGSGTSMGEATEDELTMYSKPPIDPPLLSVMEPSAYPWAQFWDFTKNFYRRARGGSGKADDSSSGSGDCQVYLGMITKSPPNGYGLAKYKKIEINPRTGTWEAVGEEMSVYVPKW